ncbi:MAG TPA: SPFH domain-containing protein, partial [Micromonosporaceae bacterium]
MSQDTPTSGPDEPDESANDSTQPRTAPRSAADGTAPGGNPIHGNATDGAGVSAVYTERLTPAVSGALMLSSGLALIVVGIILIAIAKPATIGVGVALLVVAIVLLVGLTAVAPGQARVVQLLGRYTGTVRHTGLRWVNPFSTRRRVSTRIRNHQTEVTKVNDADGNPIEIAAVVVWQVTDTAKAVFEVDDFAEFVAIQAETAVR